MQLLNKKVNLINNEIFQKSIFSLDSLQDVCPKPLRMQMMKLELKE
jgi:hypothetical protein